MIKTLAGQVKEFKKDSIITPIFMILEVIMEMIIPLLMSSIIDDGVEKGDIHHIYIIGIWMVVAAGIGLFAGIMGGPCGARASAGFARILRLRQCLKIFRHFLFPILISSVPKSGYPYDNRYNKLTELLSDASSYVCVHHSNLICMQ